MEDRGARLGLVADDRRHAERIAIELPELGLAGDDAPDVETAGERHHEQRGDGPARHAVPCLKAAARPSATSGVSPTNQ